MLSDNNVNYMLFGNPIKNSKSPEIYKIFSKNTKFFFHYDVKCLEKKNFFSFVLNFFSTHGLGANITVPYKEQALHIPHVLTDIARLSGSVNVLKKIENDRILGDNTDGIGCIYDLKRLNFIDKKYKVLLLGAGGAARGIIPHLLFLKCSVDIVNRTFSRAQSLEKYFVKYGLIRAIHVSCIKSFDYDLIINATTLSNNQKFHFFSSDVILYPERNIFYDICYSDELTPFLSWCKNHGAVYFSDGIGMLVSQAAYSFYLWSGIFPSVETVIFILNKNKKYIFY
ncbi:shikimate dehydrogenase [Buchnera aphidicola]|uniref:shikimate dehydrogenase n=1 Tax=Buchnera aphidicola TaxID=9 RepID=UPI0031B8006D